MAGHDDPDEHDHSDVPVRPVPSRESLEDAARLFRTLGDAGRLQVLQALTSGEACVSELATAFGAELPTMSHRLRLLRSDGLVRSRREGRHIYYALSDDHVVELITNALAHAGEPPPSDH
jgi:ArsR family transcriptional regulator, lead/cadmium/zinc/bismuth-responsive transcriptional repressor